MAEDTLNIKIKAEDLYSSSLKKMQGDFAKASLAVTGSIAGIGAAMFALAKETANVGEELLNWSKITGVNVRQLSKLREITMGAGVEVEKMFDVLKELNVKMKEAQDGTGAFSENVKHLGVQFQNADGTLRDTQTVFIEIVQALNSLENAALRTAIADELFSDAGTELLPVLMDQKEAIIGLTDETREYNQVITEETARASKQFNDTLRETESKLKGVAVTLGSFLLPRFNEFIAHWEDGVKRIFDLDPGRSLEDINEEIDGLRKEIAKIEDEKVAQGFFDRLFTGSQRINQIRKQIAALNEERAKMAAAQKDDETAPVQPATSRQIVDEQQLETDKAFLLSFQAGLNQELRDVEFQNQAANEELRQNDIDSQIEQYTALFDLEYEAIVTQNERIGNLMLQRSALEEERRRNDLAATIANEKLKKQAIMQGASNTISILENLNTLANGQHRTYFQALKVARIAEAGINTYTGATRALAEYPYPYSTVVAGLIVAAGLSQIAVIQSQSFEGGGASGGGGGIGGGGGGTPPVTAPVPLENGAGQEEQRAQAVTVIVNNPIGNEDWDQLVEDEVIPAFERANQRNIQTTFT